MSGKSRASSDEQVASETFLEGHVEKEISEDSQPEVVRPDEKPLKLWQAARQYPKTLGYCVLLTSAVLLWGYDVAMTGNLNSVDAFQEDFGVFDEEEDEYIIASNWLGAWNAGSPIGIMFGSLIAGIAQDKFGRRMVLGCGSAFSAVAVAVVYAATYVGTGRQGVFLAGKIIQGFTVGISACTAQTYMSEVLPSTLRGPILAFIPILFLFGQLISAAVVIAVEDRGDMGYRLCIISEWPFSAVPLIAAIVVPESPVHLVRKGRLDEALKSQRRLDIKTVDSTIRIAELEKLIEHEKVESAGEKETSYKDCFMGTDRRRTLIAVFASAVPQLFGLPILGDGPYFLQIAGMADRASFLFLISGIVLGIFALCTNMWLSTRAGRRRLSLITLPIVACWWLGVGIAGNFQGTPGAWAVGVFTNLVIITASLGVWPSSFVINSEVSSLRLRAKTQGIVWAFAGAANFVFSFCTPYIYNPDAGNLRGRIGFVWVAIALSTFAGFWFFVPEMKNRGPLELDIMFEKKIRAREFRKWSAREVATASVV